jgi:hypothetical protein
MPDKNRNYDFQLKWNCPKRLSLPEADNVSLFSGKGSIFMKKKLFTFSNCIIVRAAMGSPGTSILIAK